MKNMESSPGLKEFMDTPEIETLISLTRTNATLAGVLWKTGVTQDFKESKHIAKAFRGELPELPKDVVDVKTEEIKEEFVDAIEENGLTDDDLKRVLKKVWVYSRLSHPTVELAEEVISKMEGAEDTAVFNAGLAAIHAVVKHATEPCYGGAYDRYIPGEKTVVIGSIYGGTYAQLMDTARETGRIIKFITLDEFLKDGLPKDTKLVLFEPCNNPTLTVLPIPEIVEAAKEMGAMVACDNTFTPITIKPLELGVDVVIHSLTKYAGGRSEDTGGSVSGKKEFISRFRDLHHGDRMVTGTTMASRVAWAFLQNMRDLPERLYGASQNARKLQAIAWEHGLDARFIENQVNFVKVKNPKITAPVSNGMVAIDFKTNERARAFVDRMAAKGIGKSAVSLGAKTTLYSIPADTTHSEMSSAEQERTGIGPGLVRISCGIEENLIEKANEVFDELMSEAPSE
jgi:methionine-gamma-lyase